MIDWLKSLLNWSTTKQSAIDQTHTTHTAIFDVTMKCLFFSSCTVFVDCTLRAKKGDVSKSLHVYVVLRWFLKYSHGTLSALTPGNPPPAPPSMYVPNPGVIAGHGGLPIFDTGPGLHLAAQTLTTIAIKNAFCNKNKTPTMNSNAICNYCCNSIEHMNEPLLTVHMLTILN